MLLNSIFIALSQLPALETLSAQDHMIEPEVPEQSSKSSSALRVDCLVACSGDFPVSYGPISK